MVKVRFIFLIVVSILLFACKLATTPCSKIDEKVLKESLKINFDSIVEKNEIQDAGLCQIVIKRAEGLSIFYAYPDAKTFIFGDIYKDGVFLSKLTLEKLQEKIFNDSKTEMEKVVAFSYKPEGATKYIYMITDPDCPFCEKAKQLVKSWADERKVEVKVIFFPLESLHPQAKDKSIKAVCNRMSFEDYLKSKWGGSLCDEGAQKINDSISLMKKINVNGTPTFISYNGKRAVGFSSEALDGIIK